MKGTEPTPVIRSETARLRRYLRMFFDDSRPYNCTMMTTMLPSRESTEVALYKTMSSAWPTGDSTLSSEVGSKQVLEALTNASLS